MGKVKEHIYVKFKQKSLVSRKEEGREEDLGLESSLYWLPRGRPGRRHLWVGRRQQCTYTLCTCDGDPFPYKIH